MKKTEKKFTSELEAKYHTECVPALVSEFGYKNPMEIPSIKKVVVNTSIKEAVSDQKILVAAAEEMATIVGQKPVIRKAHKSISNFKLREGQPIGCSVTLRGRRMYDFLNKLMNLALPRVRDFKGVSAKSFDGKGNYTLGVTEQLIFPEIQADKVSRVFGMNITVVTSAKTDEEGRSLLKSLGMPFRQ